MRSARLASCLFLDGPGLDSVAAVYHWVFGCMDVLDGRSEALCLRRLSLRKSVRNHVSSVYVNRGGKTS